MLAVYLVAGQRTVGPTRPSSLIREEVRQRAMYARMPGCHQYLYDVDFAAILSAVMVRPASPRNTLVITAVSHNAAADYDLDATELLVSVI